MRNALEQYNERGKLAVQFAVATMRGLNAAVDVKRKLVRDVANAVLQKQDLI